MFSRAAAKSPTAFIIFAQFQPEEKRFCVFCIARSSPNFYDAQDVQMQEPGRDTIFNAGCRPCGEDNKQFWPFGFDFAGLNMMKLGQKLPCLLYSYFNARLVIFRLTAAY
jgi:hypothetical protein